MGAWLALTRADSVSDELVDARTNQKGRGRAWTWSERWAFPCGVPRLWCGHRGQLGPGRPHRPGTHTTHSTWAEGRGSEAEVAVLASSPVAPSPRPEAEAEAEAPNLDDGTRLAGTLSESKAAPHCASPSAPPSRQPPHLHSLAVPSLLAG